eukprot:gene7530-10258_t
MDKNQKPKIITTANVGSLSTYEIRQELVRRNALDIPENMINHKSLLQRLVKDLVEEEQKIAEVKVEQALCQNAIIRDEAKTEREKRKQEALARSQMRQKDPNYFTQKQEANVKKAESIENKEEPSSLDSTNDDNENEEDQNLSFDPFRSYKSGRSKISIK